MITWKELKEAVEKAGANDGTEIDYIDIYLPSDISDITIHVNWDNELTIEE